MTGLFENIRNKVIDNLNEGKGRAPLRSLFSSASAMESDLIITRSSQKEERQFTEVPIFDNIASESNAVFDSDERFQGFKFDVIRAVTPNFKISRTLHIGSSLENDKPRKRFNFETVLGTPEAYLFGALDTSLSHTARVYKSLGNGVTLQLKSSSNKEDPRSETNSIEATARFDSRDLKFGLLGGVKQIKKGLLGFVVSADATRRLFDGFSLGLKTSYSTDENLVVTGAIRYEKSMLSESSLDRLYTKRFKINRKIQEYKSDEKTIAKEFMNMLDVHMFEPLSILTLTANQNSLSATQTYKINNRFALTTAFNILKANNLPITSSWKVGYQFSTPESGASGSITNLSIMRSTVFVRFNDYLGVKASSYVDLDKDVYEFGVGVDITA